MKVETIRFAAENLKPAGDLSISYFGVATTGFQDELVCDTIQLDAHSTESEFRFACWKKLKPVVCDILLGKQ